MPDTADIAIGIGITEYRDPALVPLQAGREEVKSVLGEMASAGFVTPVEPLIGFVTRRAVEDYVQSLPGSVRRLCIYWTGHGHSGTGGDWLFTSDTESRSPSDRDSFGPDAVASLLGSQTDIAQIVMIVDCCGAGATALHVARAIATTSPPEPPPGRRAPAVSLVAATYGGEDAGQRLFAQAISDALRIGPPSAAWPAQKHMLSPQEVAAAADDWLRTNYAATQQRARSVGLEAGSAFFRNPQYDPRLRDTVVDDDVLVRRQQILDRILGWLGTTDSGLYLLTGSMGTGKSYVLLQLQSDAPAPEAGQGRNNWIFLKLAGLSLQQCADVLAPRFGLSVTPDSAVLPEDVVRACAAAGRPVTLVVDAPDEAEQLHRVPIVQRLLIPLAAIPRVHVVVADRGGARSAAVDEFSELRRAAVETFDLDEDPDSTTDIARHVLRVLLTTAHSPYAGQADLAGAVAVADELARCSDGIFLTADMIAQSLAREPETVTADRHVLGGMVREGMAAALERRFAMLGQRGSQLFDILTPLAWSAGPGVPLGTIWPLMANAIRPEDSVAPAIDEQSITDALADAGSFVTRTLDNGRELYRIRHEAVAEYLRSRSPFTGTAVHRRICEAIRPPARGWQQADPYVLTYLADHAERGGVLSQAFADPDFMIYCAPAETLAAATRMDLGDRTGPVDLYLRCGPLLEDASPSMRAFVLESLICEGFTRGGLSQWLSFSIEAPCYARWTTAGQPWPHRLIRSKPDRLEAVAGVRTRNGYRIAAANDYFGPGDSGGVPVETWDPALAVPMQPLDISGSGARATYLAAAWSGDEDVLIVAYHNDVLESRSLSRNDVLWRHDSDRIYSMSVVPAHVESLIATSNSSDPIVLSRVSTGEVVRELPAVSGGAMFATGFQADGHNVICAGTNTGYLDFFATDSGAHLGTVQPEETWICAVAVVDQGVPLLVGARDDGRIEVRDARNGSLKHTSMQETAEEVEAMIALDAGFGSGIPAIATADGALITLWSCKAERLRILRGHAGDVSALTTAPGRTGHEAIVSVSRDGTIRIWEGFGGSLGTSSHDARTAKGSFSNVFPARANGKTVILAEDLMSMATIDGSDGHMIKKRHQPTRVEDWRGREIESYGRGVWAVAQFGGNALALTDHDGSTQRMWDIESEADYAVPTPGVSGPRPRQVLLTRPDQPLLVIGGNDERIGVFTFEGRRQCWLSCPDGSVPLMPVSSSQGNLVLVYSGGESFDVHDPVTGAKLGGAPARKMATGSSRPIAAISTVGTGSDIIVVHGTPNVGTWLTHSSGFEIEVLPGQSPQCGTVATVAGQMLFALGWENKVVLVRPDDGAILAKMPLTGTVHDISAPEPGSLCLVAADRIIWIDLLDRLAEKI